MRPPSDRFDSRSLAPLDFLRFGAVIGHIVVILATRREAWSPGDLAWLLAPAAVILGLMALSRRWWETNHRLMFLNFVGQSLAVTVLALRLPGYWQILYFVVAGQTMFFLPPRQAVLAIAVAWILQCVSFILPGLAQGPLDPAGTVLNVLGMGAGLAFFGASSFLAVNQAAERRRAEEALAALRAANEELAQAHRQLSAYAREIEQLAAARERNRLAQEIHDALAHTFTSLILQLESCSRQVKADPEQALQTVGKVLSSARQGLDEVRKSVRMIYPESEEKAEVVPGLAQLCRDFAADTGIQVNLTIHGEARRLSAAAGKALYRTLQESLTNAGRHGAATEVSVILSFSPERVQLVASDNGRGAASPSEGFGLRGMRERASALNGSFRLETSPGQGFSITMVLPA